MITYVDGNLLASVCDAIVLPVNCDGAVDNPVLGAMRGPQPESLATYKLACMCGLLTVGKVFTTYARSANPWWIVYFPIRRFEREPVTMQSIEAGLDDLRRECGARRMVSLALPVLGCISGGLREDQVKPLIEKKLGGLDMDIQIYCRGGFSTVAA